MKQKDVKVAGYVCHALMMHQVLLIDDLFEKSKRFVKDLSRQEFDEILTSLNSGGAITGISDNGYIYQTSSTLIKQKTKEEIMALIKQ